MIPRLFRPRLGLFLREIGRAERRLGGRDRQQRRVELDEGGVDRGVVLVAGVAGGGLRDEARRLLTAEAEEAPATLEARRVLDVHFDGHAIALGAAALVDRGVLLG